MTFTPGIPASGQSLGSSRTQVLNNMASLRSTLDVDHIDVNDSGAGKHNKATLVEQASDPVTSANEIDIYSKEIAAATEWFLRREGSGAVIQMSSGNPTTAGAFPSTGQTFLPGGFQLKWGTGSASGGQSTVTFGSAFPNNGLTGGVFAFASGSQFNMINVTKTAITFASPGSGSCIWFAIGN